MAKTISSPRVPMPDGTSIERKYKTLADGTREPYGNWLWLVYDPDRRPTRKRVNLYTRDQAGAHTKALALSRRREAGTFDPWCDASGAEAVTVQEAVERYLKAKTRADVSPETVKTYRANLDGFAASLAAGFLVRHVERRHVEAYLDRPKPNGDQRSGKTKNRIRACIQPFLAWAVDQGLATSNPAVGIKATKAKSVRRDGITPGETAAILRAIEAAEVRFGEPRDWLKDWLLFGVATGLRPGEQAQLRWSAVRLAEGTLTVGKDHRVKTANSARTIPVRGQALDVLRRRAEARTGEGDGLVFTGAGGGKVSDRYLSKCLQGFAKEAGVAKNVTAYSLRHAFGSEMTNRGVPVYFVARLMGTSVAMIEAHYGHFDPAAGAAHLDRVFGSGESLEGASNGSGGDGATGEPAGVPESPREHVDVRVRSERPARRGRA